MGSEPCHVCDGPIAGTMVFTAEQWSGLGLIRSLDDRQAQQAILHWLIDPDDLPTELQDPVDGRMVAGAFRDNAVIPYAGVCAADYPRASGAGCTHWWPPTWAGPAKVTVE